MADIRKVIVVPGRVAFVTPEARKKFSDKPISVVWNAYYEELLNVHHDIEIIEEPKVEEKRPTPARPVPQNA